MRFPIELAVASPSSVVPGPGQGWVYEPKYDGWRGCLHSGPGRLHSRSGTELSGRFPELLAAAGELALDEAVLDGELVAVRGDAARLEFAALQAGPRRRRAEGVVVYFLVFDLLASKHGHDLRSYPYAQRRAALEALLSGAPSPLQPVPQTTDREAALDWLDPAYGTVGIEGVVAKPSGPYRRGRASGWRKTRHTVTTEAVVAGVSTGASGQHSLVLALPTATGRWHAVGLSQPLPEPAQHELAGKLEYLGLTARLPGIVAGLPGQQQVDYVPVAPSVVVEIETDAVGEHGRLRHRPRYVRTRPDRRPGDLPQEPGPGWPAGGRTTSA